MNCVINCCLILTTMAWQARNTGIPLMRALWLHYPKDEKAWTIGSQYLWGRDLLIAPVFEKGATTRSIYLPRGEWYDWWTNKKEQGEQTITREIDLLTMPIYVRAGSIIPTDPVRQYTGQTVTGPTVLRVYEGTDGSFTLYDDDGISQDYLEGKGSWIKIKWDDAYKTLTLQPDAPRGSVNLSTRKTFSVQLLPSGIIKDVDYTGASVTLKF